jgi:type VI secretion system secreted protein VgrG
VPGAISLDAAKDAVVESFSGVEAMSRLYTYRVDLLSPAPIDFSLLGKAATVRISAGKDVSLGGIVSRLAEGTAVGKMRRYRVEISPRAWLLTRGLQSRIFQDHSVPEILAKVFQDLTVSVQLQGQYPKRVFCAQYRESDFDFASRLMEEEGIFWFFEQPSGNLIIADAVGALPQLPGSPLKVSDLPGWQTAQEIRAHKVTLRDHTFELPNDFLEAAKNVPASVQAGAVTHSLAAGPAAEIYDDPGGYAKRFDGVDPGGGDQPAQLQKIFHENTRVAALRAEEEAAQAVVSSAGARCVNLISGRKFTLQGDDRAAGDYLITRVEHSVTEKDGRVQIDSRIECLPASAPPRPRRVTPRPVARLQSAVVAGPAGEKLFLDKYGRVKVQFHWDRQGRSDAGSSGWVPVAQVAASRHSGAMFPPRVGDEALVDFLDGDPDRPVIVGRLYNAENMPPAALPAHKTLSYVGVEGPLRLNYGETTLDLLDDGRIEQHGKSLLVASTGANGSKVKILADGTGITVQSDGPARLSAGGAAVTVDQHGAIDFAGAELDLHTGDARVRLQKDGSLLLTGKDVDVHADGSVDVKGSKVATD